MNSSKLKNVLTQIVQIPEKGFLKVLEIFKNFLENFLKYFEEISKNFYYL